MRGEADNVYATRYARRFDARRIFLVGLSGSGKSVIGARLAKQNGIALYDTDARVLELSGCRSISEIFEARGEAYFRSLEVSCLDEIATIKARMVVATGGGLPAIPGAMSRMTEMGVVVYLRASVDELWRRLIGDLKDRPLLRGDGREALDHMREAREPTYLRAAISLDTESLTVAQVSALLQAQYRTMKVLDVGPGEIEAR